MSPDPFKARIDFIREQYERAGLAGSLADNLIGQFVEDYADPFPFILELIQNAVDSAAPGKRVRIHFQLREDDCGWTLFVSNDGAPFSIADVDRLCGVNRQRKGAGKIGYKGLGFKTVSLLSDNPRVYSKGCQFEFNKALHPGQDQLWIVIPHWIEPSHVPASIPSQNDWVSFALPVRSDVSLDGLSRALDGLTSAEGVALLLFLQDLDELTVANARSSRSATVRKATDADHPLVCHLQRLTADPPASEGDLLGSWIVTHFPSRKSMGTPLPIPELAIDEYRRRRGSEPNYSAPSLDVRPLISLAFRTLSDETGVRFQPNKKGTVCAFFPIQREVGSGLRFSVQADFLTTQNREAILPGSAWNKWIFDNMHLAIASAAQELQDRPQWNQIIYDSMPLDDEGIGPFKEVTKSLCELLRKARIVLTDAAEPHRWRRPSETTWIEDPAIRELIAGNEEEVLGRGKTLVSSQVKSSETNRQRAGSFLRLPRGMGVQEIKRDHILALLHKQDLLDRRAKDLDWFEKLLMFLADGKGVNDKLIAALTGNRFIPTREPGVLAGTADVYIPNDEPSSFDPALVVNDRIWQEPRISKLLVNRLRVPIGADAFLRSVILSQHPERQGAQTLWKNVRLAKACYDHMAASAMASQALQADRPETFHLMGIDHKWRPCRDLHMPRKDDLAFENARTVAVHIPEDPAPESWRQFFLWLGVQPTPLAFGATSNVQQANDVSEREGPSGEVASQKRRTPDPGPTGTLPEDSRETTAPLLGVDAPPSEEIARHAPLPPPSTVRDQSGETQVTGRAGERIAFAFVRDEILKKFSGLSPTLEQDDDRFLIQSEGKVLAEGVWGNGPHCDDPRAGDWGEHFDFWVSLEGETHYYEVKATAQHASVMSQGSGDKIRLTPSESAWAAEAGSHYHVVRVYSVDEDTAKVPATERLVIIDDPLSLLRDGTLVVILKGTLPGAYKICVKQMGRRP